MYVEDVEDVTYAVRIRGVDVYLGDSALEADALLEREGYVLERWVVGEEVLIYRHRDTGEVAELLAV